MKLEKFKYSWKLSYGNQNKISAEGWKVDKKLEIKNIEFKNKEIGRSIQSKNNKVARNRPQRK